MATLLVLETTFDNHYYTTRHNRWLTVYSPVLGNIVGNIINSNISGKIQSKYYDKLNGPDIIISRQIINTIYFSVSVKDEKPISYYKEKKNRRQKNNMFWQKTC